MINYNVDESWTAAFNNAQHELEHIRKKLDIEKVFGTYYPSSKYLFNAFKLTKLNDVKVIIFGYEPYNLPGKDQGLAFSVNNEDEVPKSIINMYKELSTTIPNFITPNHGNLTAWCNQGVLLINQCLTVSAKQSHSEYEIWYGFLKKAFQSINAVNPNVIVLLWGQKVKNVTKILPNTFVVLEAGDPGGYNAHRNFIGCGHFAEVNKLLAKQKRTPINWSINY